MRLLPKVELHCHLLGTLRPSTAAQLASRHGVKLPMAPSDLYPRIASAPLVGPEYERTAVTLPHASAPGGDSDGISGGVGLLEASQWLARTIREPGDFSRVAYEAQEDAFEQSNVRYRELFFEPGWYLGLGVDYADMVDGLIDGLQAAETDLGVVGRLIAGIDRQVSSGAATELVEVVVANPRAEIIGIGLEGSELAGPPERFVDAYRLAGSHGLHRTAHAGEHVPTAEYVVSCLDLLGCERIDHGYFVLEDPAAVARCRDDGVVFVGAFTTSRRAWIPWRRESIGRMIEAGLRVTLGSDDPAMFPTTLTEEYLQARQYLDLDLGRILVMALDAIDASWLSDDDKAVRRVEVTAESTRLADLHGLTVDPNGRPTAP